MLDPDEWCGWRSPQFSSALASCAMLCCPAALPTNGLKLPRLIQSGPETGQIVWVRPSYQMLHRMLVNPAYAGTFVYGRTKREVTPGDPPATSSIGGSRRRRGTSWCLTSTQPI